jgi:TonB family protein
MSLPLPPPPPSVDFIEPALTPHRNATPIRAVGQTRLPAMGNAKAFALNAPRPEYPYEARSRHLTGSGIAVISVDPITGFTTAVAMEQSIGNRILDNSIVSAFRRWRFRPGSPSRVRIPITFLLTGAQY